ncbi:hypothetical protein SAMN05192558_101777 [Actinokineospora alba]|uniref:Uncharacterized protein n=1 Tax=Actinokineospora alba TaxID=504798 RepID=A0A1H0GFB4_9PSEU|nr:hypothetical protein [Actinokineospora alba]TDP69874.1 hypothetical protein C8E96_5470 [Actinokineospora alba]SDI06904.1 hypothetical protein SAMN05421871_10394 [Actinokineospora alba]SDO05617.1 hypothetical protein SAMN05192558_101777 [Actinokineospora alba]
MELSEREYFAAVGTRPGMYVSRPSFLTLSAFVTGYGECAARHGAGALDGWREWLIARSGKQDSPSIWWALVLDIAFPNGWTDPSDLGPADEAHAVEALFELLDEFLARVNTA